jgi:hypothetical protein
MFDMAASPCIQCRIDPQIKLRLRAIAVERGSTESAVLKRLIVSVIAMAPASDARVPAVEPIGPRARVYVRLRRSDHALLRERAAARGLAAATYVSMLVRTHLQNAPSGRSRKGDCNRAHARGYRPSSINRATQRRSLDAQVGACDGRWRLDRAVKGRRSCLDRAQPDLDAVLARLKALKPDIPREFLIRKRNGRGYIENGFSAIWQRLQQKYAKAGVLPFMICGQ